MRMTREILPTTVPDGDNSSPNVLIKTGGTKSKQVSYLRRITVSLENIFGGFLKANSSMICVTNIMLLLLITFLCYDVYARFATLCSG